MKTFITSLLLVNLSICFAQEAEFNWVAPFGGVWYEEVEAVAVDDGGNVFSAGWFRNTIDLDPGTGTVELTAANNSDDDAYISKLDSNGQFVWGFSLGWYMDDRINDMVLDSDGNVVVTGFFVDQSGTIDFDPSAATVNFTSFHEDAFVAKYDTDGNLVWAKHFQGTTGGGGNTDVGTSVAVDSDDNIIITGFFADTVDFDPGVDEYWLDAEDGNVFVCKLNAQGQFLWAKQTVQGQYPLEEIVKTGVDQWGDIYIGGRFRGTVTFDPLSGQHELTSNNTYDIFVAKYSASGSFEWVGSISGGSLERFGDMVIDNDGNSYITGTIESETDFDPDDNATFLLSEIGFRDVFVCKWNKDRNHVWSGLIGTHQNSANYSYGIDVDHMGSVYTTGLFNGNADFDPGAGTQLLSHNRPSCFVSKLNSMGEYVWAKPIKAINVLDMSWGTCIETDAAGNIYVGGMFEGETDFDPDMSVTHNLTSVDEEDSFVTKWNYVDNMITSTGVVSNDEGLRFYPNPAHSNLWVEVDNTFDKNHLQVLDMQGRLVLQEQLVQGRQNVALPELVAGTYVIRFVNDQNVISQKLVIE